MFKKTSLALAAVAALGLVAVGSQSASAAGFYKGKQIKITIGYGFGGTYGKYSRLFSEHLGNFIEGNPKIIVASMPGAGGIKMMNFAAKVMPNDGLNLIIPVDASILSQVIFADKVKFDFREFISLGSANQTNVIVVVRTDQGITNWKQLKDKEVTMGATGRGSTSFLVPNMMNSILGTKFKVVTGYKGSAKTGLSIEQGETFGSAFNWLYWDSKYPQWFKGDKPFAIALMQVGVTADKALPNVPMLKDQVTGMDRKIVEYMGLSGLIGRGLAVPKGTDMARVKELRVAFNKMVHDPKFIADVTKRRLRVIATTGEEIQKIVASAIGGVTKEFTAAAKKAILGK